MVEILQSDEDVAVLRLYIGYKLINIYFYYHEIQPKTIYFFICCNHLDSETLQCARSLYTAFGYPLNSNHTSFQQRPKLFVPLQAKTSPNNSFHYLLRLSIYVITYDSNDGLDTKFKFFVTTLITNLVTIHPAGVKNLRIKNIFLAIIKNQSRGIMNKTTSLIY